MKLRELRELRIMTQDELAARSGIAQSTIHYLENGKQSPTERTLKKLAAALEVDISELLEGSGEV